MKSLLNISAYNRKWSNISLLYRIEQMKQEGMPITYYKETLLVRRRSDYFYIQQPPGQSHVFLPDSSFREFWELFSIILIIYQQITISYALCYTSESSSIHMKFLLFCDLYFVIEVLLNLNTGYFSEGVLVKYRHKIVQKYLKSDFFPDVFACFPLQLFLKNMEFEREPDPVLDSSDYIKFVWLMKIFNLLKLSNIFSNFQYRFTSELISTFFNIFKFFLYALIVIHWITCLMYLTFLKDLENVGFRWNFIYNSGNNVYLKYFYMTVATMTSTGYGDITPFSINQKLLAIGVMSLSCWLFAFILSNTKDILLKYTSIESYYKDKIQKLKKYLSKHKIARKLRFRVISYLQFMKENQKKRNLKESQILEMLSPTLREDVYIITRGSIIQKCLAFRHLSLEFLRMIIRSLNHSIFAPNDIIFKENDRSNTIYFIMNGKIEIYHEATQTVFRELKNLKHFGEIAFFIGKNRVASARSLIFSEVLHLSKFSMDEMLLSRPKDHEANRIVLMQAQYSLNALSIRCYLCNRGGHIAKDCKKFVILMDKKDIIYNAVNRRYNFNQKVPKSNKHHENVEKPMKRYNKRNSIGEKNQLEKKFPINQRLQNKCNLYSKEEKVIHYKYHISKEHFDESEESEMDIDVNRSDSILPKQLQYSNIFRRKSTNSVEIEKEYRWDDEGETMTFGNKPHV